MPSPRNFAMIATMANTIKLDNFNIIFPTTSGRKDEACTLAEQLGGFVVSLESHFIKNAITLGMSEQSNSCSSFSNGAATQCVTSLTDNELLTMFDRCQQEIYTLHVDSWYPNGENASFDYDQAASIFERTLSLSEGLIILPSQMSFLLPSYTYAISFSLASTTFSNREEVIDYVCERLRKIENVALVIL